MGKQLTDVSNNITEGGDVNYIFEHSSLTIDGRYEKVVENELLEYTWNWHLASQPGEGVYKLSVRFSGDENKAEISITQEGFSNDEAVLPHKQGWEQGLQQLQHFLSNRQNNASASDGGNSGENVSGQQKPPITGYNETPEQLKVAGG